MEWMGKWGTAYVCSNCGLLQEFYNAEKFGIGYNRAWLWVTLALVVIYAVVVILGAINGT